MEKLELNKVYCMDCLEGLKELGDNSVDAVVTDPPYGLKFMGKKWDYDVPSVEIWIECLRVLKPGGFLLSFGGSRTYHRMAVNIEDAGFEIRDQIMWIYGSGFPKSLNIGKAIDKLQGNKRESEGIVKGRGSNSGDNRYNWNNPNDKTDRRFYEKTIGCSEWEGWGTALKPAHEPIVVARKPLSEKSVALNVLKWGTGGINIDECRIGNEIIKEHKSGDTSLMGGLSGKSEQGGYISPEHKGRFPANIIFDEEAGRMLDKQSGDVGNGHWANTKVTGFGEFGGGKSEYFGVGLKDKVKGGASRFFYCAKSSKSERNKGCENLDEKQSVGGVGDYLEDVNSASGKYGSEKAPSKNIHPTVKPIKLMEYLIKLVSKENSLVLDPFIGSGTTGIACIKRKRNFIGFEKEKDYIEICKARIKPFLSQKSIDEWFKE